MSRSREYRTYRFDIDLDRIISKVYFSRHRELLREFASLEDFKDVLFSYSMIVINDQLSYFLNIGFNLLETQEDDGFVDFVEDETFLKFDTRSFSEVKTYLIENAIHHFYAYLALRLMEDTDIEDYLNRNLHLIKITKWYFIFKGR